MSKTLPALGSGGMDIDAFLSQKDQAGVLSRVSAGRGWVAWNFDAAPANADLMIQLLADESLRPTWPKPDELAAILAKTLNGSPFRDAMEEAVHAFRVAIGDPGVPQLPLAPIDGDRFVAIWASSIRRPEKCVLSIAGDIESVSVKRIINQHFGPWEGIRPGGAGSAPAAAEWQERVPGPAIQHAQDASAPELWIGWNLQSLLPSEAAIVEALAPWILRLAVPAPDEIIKAWEPDPGGRWLRVIGHVGASHEKLEAHALSIMRQPPTQGLLERAVRARIDYINAGGLYPGRALVPENSFDPPALGRLREMLQKCMKPDNLAVLRLAY